MGKIYNISASKPFLPELARLVSSEVGNLEESRIYLPLERAIFPLQEAFLKLSGSEVILLPKISSIGEVDEEEIIANYPDIADTIPQTIPKLERLFCLSRLIYLKMGGSFSHSVVLAKKLINLIDELQTKSIGFEALENVVEEEFAEHWQITLDFLKIISEDWKEYLSSLNLIEPIQRRNLFTEKLGSLLNSIAQTKPVIIAGSTGSVPATAELMKQVLAAPHGYIVLEGLDREIDNDIQPTHPQFNLTSLLQFLRIEKSEVIEFGEPVISDRQKLISTSLLPTSKTEIWQNFEGDSSGLELLECKNLEEETSAIALILREVLEHKEKRAFVVTTNRNLARMICAKMRIWNVELNDSAGQPLIQTPNADFMMHLIEFAADRNSPIKMLSLFKHPFIEHELKEKVRALELKTLHGLRPEKIGYNEFDINMQHFAKLFSLFEQEQVPLKEIINEHISLSETLATKEKLYSHSGNDLKEFLQELNQSIRTEIEISPSSYPEVFRQFLLTKIYRPKFGQNPQINIYSPIEARFQSADIVILAGMNEGSFPELPSSDSFMNQQIRKQIGLDLLDRKIGQAAHDFEILTQEPYVIMTRSLKEGGSPTTKSRFLQRLEAICDIKLGTNYLAWAQQFYISNETRKLERPMPKPPLEARPKRLSATNIGKLIRDPYYIYTKYVLRLKKLEPIDLKISGKDFGNFIHAALEGYSKDPSKPLIEHGKLAFKQYENLLGVRQFWWPRFENIAKWFELNPPTATKILYEENGEIEIAGFKIHCVADRVEINQSIKIIDYKTGTPPTKSHVEVGLEPQLPIEAIIFQTLLGKKVTEMEYWELKGYNEEPNIVKIDNAQEIIEEAEQGLEQLISKFNLESTAYIARPWTHYALQYNDFEHLERIKEWQ